MVSLQAFLLRAVVITSWWWTKAVEGTSLPAFSANTTTGVDLGGHDYTGTIPTQFGLLTGATHFAVDNNKLTGALPSELGLLNRVTYLSVGRNALSSSLPTQFGLLASLHSSLVLQWNDLTSQLPTQLGQLVNMTSQVVADDNLFESSVPTQLGLLTGLTGALFLERNSVEGRLPSQLGHLTALETAFVLMQNQLHHQLPTELGQLTTLKVPLGLQNNQFTGRLPSQLGMLSQLTARLNLHGNSFTGALPSEIGQLTALEDTLNLGSNQLSGPLPSEVGALAALHRALSIEANSFTAQLPTQIGQLTGVKADLYLFSNDFSGEIVSQLGRLTALTAELLLRATQFDGVPTELGQLTAITQYFDLGYCQYDAALPSQLGSLVAMEAHFDMSNNGFTSLPTELGRLSALEQSFDLSSNSLFGGVPTQLGLLQSMTSAFRLFSNQLCDDLPTEVTALSSQVTDWAVVTSNDLGSECCAEAHCGPSMAPTLSPTAACLAGEYYEPDGNTCEVCPAGKFRNTTSAPAVCSWCEVGYYRAYSSDSSNAHLCYECPTGRVSTSERASCDMCSAGQYVLNETSCVDCEAGRYAPTAVEDSCYLCPSGFSTGVLSGASSCKQCDAGTYSAGLAVNCTTCPAGTYSTSSSSGCTDCSSGYFSSSHGATSCSKCSSELGQAYTSDEGETRCDVCVSGYYWDGHQDAGEECVQCQEHGVDCEEPGNTLAYLQVEHGWFRFTANSTSVYECPHHKNCKGGNSTVNADQCHKGSEGPLCALCSVGYYLNSFRHRCVECNATSSSTLAAVSAVGVLFLVGMALLWQRRRVWDWYVYHWVQYKTRIDNILELATVCAVTMQTVVLLRSNHSALGGNDMQAPYSAFVTAFSFLSFDIVRGVPIGCAHDVDHLDYMVSWVTLPALIFLAGWIALRRSKPKMRELFLSYYMQALFLVLPTISSTICESFRCSRYDDGEYEYLTQDYHINCHSVKYRWLVALASLAVLAYPIGVPLLLFLWLLPLRQHFDPPALDERSAVLSRVADSAIKDCAVRVFALRYKPSYWYWEVYVILRRLALTSVSLVFSSSDSMMLFILTVSIVTTVIEREAQPHLRAFLAAFTYLCNWLIVLVVIAMLVVDAGMTSGPGTTFIGCGLIIINSVIVGVVFYDRRAKRLRRKTRSTLEAMQTAIATRDSFRGRSSSAHADSRGRSSSAQRNHSTPADVDIRRREFDDFTFSSFEDSSALDVCDTTNPIAFGSLGALQESTLEAGAVPVVELEMTTKKREGGGSKVGFVFDEAM